MIVAFKKLSKALKLLCFTTILLGLVGCAQSDTLQEKGQAFVERALSAPSEQFAEINALQLTPANPEQYDEYVAKAMGAIGEGLVSEKTI
ncbi:MAG: hypothetical protein RR273_07000 [Oscillospiraceae bacterium]